jgi:monoamine oxidase
MERRKFLKQTAYISAGAVIIPSLLTTACAKDPVLPDSNFSGKVLIIGAGAAGLYAGYTLSRGGYDFEILEASDRIGGRMGSNTQFADHDIDLGAQWLHGKKSIAGDLVKMNDVKVNKDKSEMFYLFNGSLTDKLDADPTKLFGSSASSDISYFEYTHGQGFGAEYDWIMQGACSSYGADSKELSAKFTPIEEDEWSSGNKDYKFEKTYWDLINDNIVAPIQGKITTNAVVQSIDYSGSTITVTLVGGSTYTADKVIVTVPLPILQDGDITFIPPLPAAQTTAFGKIGMGAGMKAFLKFSDRFYKANTAGGSVCAAYADDKEGKNGSDNILLAFIMGDQAQALSDLGSDDAIAQALLAELDQIYDGKASASYQDKLVIDYTTMPFIRGAYSFSAIGIEDARKTAAQSVNDKLFFAGEAMNLNGIHQTVQGALETGYDQVIKILENA